jgi:hypothetical protein
MRPRAIGEGGKRLEPEIYADLVSGNWQWFHRYVRTREGDVPTIGLVRDRYRLGCVFNGAAPTNSKTPEFRYHQKAIVKGGPVAKLLVGIAVSPLVAL